MMFLGHMWPADHCLSGPCNKTCGKTSASQASAVTGGVNIAPYQQHQLGGTSCGYISPLPNGLIPDLITVCVLNHRQRHILQQTLGPRWSSGETLLDVLPTVTLSGEFTSFPDSHLQESQWCWREAQTKSTPWLSFFLFAIKSEWL